MTLGSHPGAGRRRPRRLLLPGCLAAAGMSAFLVFLTEGNLWTILSIIGLVVIGAASFMGIKVADKLLRKAMINDLFAPVVESQKRYLQFVAMVGHDRDVAERLIEHERRYAPKANRNILVENAIKRWERDNRVQ